MERLTQITEIGNAYFPKCFEEPCCGMGKCIDNNCNLVNEVCKKLAEYETLEEQGLLVRLPCKVGTKVYTIFPYFDCIYNYENCKVTQKWKCEEDIPCEYEKRLYCVEEIEFNLNLKDVIGKTVFLTCEEAEKKLEEMKNGL